MYLVGVYLVGVYLWVCTSLGMHPMGCTCQEWLRKQYLAATINLATHRDIQLDRDNLASHVWQYTHKLWRCGNCGVVATVYLDSCLSPT